MIVTRFAPSPTGFLHLGHAFAALTAHDAAERFLLRIEDIDPIRCRAQFEAAIIEDLTWLGLGFEEPVLRQSSRHDAYRVALDELKARGLFIRAFAREPTLRRRSHAPSKRLMDLTGRSIREPAGI